MTPFVARLNDLVGEIEFRLDDLAQDLATLTNVKRSTKETLERDLQKANLGLAKLRKHVSILTPEAYKPSNTEEK